MSVLYVTGWCRSGTTLLGNLLNELPGVVHVGELHYLWRNGVLETGTNTDCGCGQPVAECPLWDKVLSAIVAPTSSRSAEARAAIADQHALLRTRHTRARLREPGPGRAAVDRIVRQYRAIAEATDARIVVDSSKYPAEAAALCRRDDVDVRVLHLVRDPRATAHSWRRAKAYIPAMSVARSSAYWTGFNAASDAVGRAFPDRYLRLRYEDFVSSPAAALRDVLDLCGLADPPPVDAQGSATLGTNHTVTGNPDRMVRGPVVVRPDDRWRQQAGRRDRFAATVLALPLLRRYAYGLT